MLFPAASTRDDEGDIEVLATSAESQFPDGVKFSIMARSTEEIDDQALRRRLGARGYPHRYDLGEEWFRWTSLPFVFSRWVARNDLDADNFALLADTLYVGLEYGVEVLFHESEPRDRLLMLYFSDSSTCNNW